MNFLLPNSDLKKVEKTTRPFRYGLNQIPYDYTVEVTNRFQGLALIEWLKNYGWRFVTFANDQNHHPQGKKCKKAKWFSEEALQIAKKRKGAKGKEENERYTHLNAKNSKFQRIARRNKKAFLSD